MSNEPSSKRLLDELLPDPADAAAEAIAPDAVARLRSDLGEMTELIAQVGAEYEAAGSTDEGVAALLYELDVRVRRMRAIVDPAAEAAAPAGAEHTPEEQAFLEAMKPNGEPESAPQPDRVPTVSDVVWQLGLTDEVDIPDAPGADQPDDGRTSAVAMLEARVKALAEAMPPEPPPADEVAYAAPEPPPEPAAPEEAPPQPEPAAYEETSPPESQPESTAAEEAPARSPAIPEVELMWNFERMESEPYFPPEVGEAVIFGRERIDAAADAAPPGEPTGEAAPAQAQPAQAQPAEVDLDALLFEPPPEADPAAFLLEPEPAPEPPEPLTLEPQAPPPEPAAELVSSVAPEPVSEAPDAATWDVEPAVPVGAPPPGTQPDGPQDPLAPLMTMSDEEKIALFE